MLLQVGCADGLQPGDGPGFSIVEPAPTGEELHDALRFVSVIDEDDVEVGEEVTEDCPDGGTETFRKKSNGSDDGGIFRIRYADCGVTIMLRGQEYEVVVNGREDRTFERSENVGLITSKVRQSFSGDLGFSAECDRTITIATTGGNVSHHGTVSCRFEDSEGTEIFWDSGFSNEPI